MGDPVSFMMRAIELARQGMRRGDGGPFGAVVAREGEIIGEGWNRVLATNDPTAHAEIMAIRAASARLGSFSLDGCEIHSTGEPCPMCLGAIQWARLGVIFHGFRVEEAAEVGFNDREFFRQMTLPKEERRIPTRESCRTEALELLREYAQLPGKRIY
jgi:tRNA(Arg) A34 adenosine deaminase TadA